MPESKIHLQFENQTQPDNDLRLSDVRIDSTRYKGMRAVKKITHRRTKKQNEEIVITEAQNCMDYNDMQTFYETVNGVRRETAPSA